MRIVRSAEGKTLRNRGFGVLIALGVLLRLVALSSDPYARLSWSAALVTDEGFYLHNARNVVLFGQPQLDGFQNRLIMPTLHAVQVGLFSSLPFSLVMARLFTVLCGLLTLLVFWVALRRAFNAEVAKFGVLFLAFDPVPLLYNRMALMDTPATLLMVMAFALFVHGIQFGSKKAFCLFGLFLGFAFSVRGLFLLVVPLPFLLLWRERKICLAMGFGFALFLIPYIALWWLPHRSELAQMNAFYFREQLLPQSLNHFGSILITSLLGDDRGICSFMMRHSPILFLGGVFGLGYWYWAGRKETWDRATRQSILFLGGWLVWGLFLFSVIGYAPSRYYILFYPALCGVCALLTVRLTRVQQVWLEHPLACGVLGAFCGFHLVLAFRPLTILGYVGVGVGCVLGLLCLKPLLRGLKAKWGVVCLTVWIIIACFRLQDWLRHIEFQRNAVGTWIQQNLPSNAVLLGDVASGVALDTRLQIVPVIPNLCNDRSPVEQFAGRPRYIVILDGQYREKWWFQHYPALLTAQNRVAYFPRVVKYPVGIYRVP